MLTALLLIALAFLVHRRFLSGYAPPPPGLAVLHRGEATFIDAAAEVLFPGGGSLPVAGIDAHLPHYIDRHLAALPHAQRFQIRALFLLFEHGTLFFPGDAPGGRRRFSSLSAAARVSILARLSKHSNGIVRLVFMALRAVLTLGYLGHPGNLCALGVAPFEIQPGVSDAELLFPRIGGLVSSIRYRPEDRTDPARLGPLDPHGPRHRAYARANQGRR